MFDRYDLNRLARRIQLVEPLDNFRKEITEGYFPNMTTNTSGQNIPPRPDHTYMHDISNAKVGDLERWYNRLMEAIDNGVCVDVCNNHLKIHQKYHIILGAYH